MDLSEFNSLMAHHIISRGWHVYRIKWINPYWDEQAVLKQIEDFLTWYRGIIEHEV